MREREPGIVWGNSCSPTVQHKGVVIDDDVDDSRSDEPSYCSFSATTGGRTRQRADGMNHGTLIRSAEPNKVAGTKQNVELRPLSGTFVMFISSHYTSVNRSYKYKEAQSKPDVVATSRIKTKPSPTSLNVCMCSKYEQIFFLRYCHRLPRKHQWARSRRHV